MFDRGLSLAVGLAALVFFGGLIGLGANVDRLARHREETQAVNALKGRMQEVGDQVVGNADWDDAVAHASNILDMPWISENIGFFFSQPSRFQFVYLIAPDGRRVFGMDHGKAADPAHFAPLDAAAAPLIADIRVQEARRGPFAGHSKDGRMLSRPILAHDVVRFEGQLFILTATLIQPDFGTAIPGPRASIIVTGKPVDAAFMDSLAQRLLLDHVRLVGPEDTAKAYIDLDNRGGERFARIAWNPQQPGGDVISIALLPILVGVGAPLLLYLRGKRTARRLEATLEDLGRARDEADAANRHKTTFLATMSHEIRTPLNGVLAMAQVMDLNPLSPEQRQRLSVISHSSETLLTIVNDILDLSKIEAGKLDLDERPFDIGALAQALQGLYAPMAAEKGLGFAVEVADEARGRWKGDPDRLRQVVANLVSNALKFTEAGEIAVLVCRSETGGLRVEVRDTGIGISTEKLDVIFDKFSQAESSTARRFGGTGLGLAIGRQLVEAMGGRMWVTSALGCGSIFAFEVPLAKLGEAVEDEARAAQAASAPSGQIRILAADDNETNRQVLAAILEPLEVGLDLCEDGAQALAAWRGGGYDLILMDIQMPGMDGLDATRAIREIEGRDGRPRTPIIALTANAMTHQLAEYRAAGMDDCVAKPIRIAELHEAMVRVLAAAEAAAEAA
ncbi:ATP-binding protein [Phenylobacterium montanum]|uniref:Sensory/regulatory protein RpfC n=1 Tax=Phenylobacterium montanum TaxID=2823693 RepID=A0A975IVW2_9CAUL|nr:ATP-binding protein [Caulobacter sp. S6]QUD87751.1 response regulator [Caulobacter sp. S6]